MCYIDFKPVVINESAHNWKKFIRDWVSLLIFLAELDFPKLAWEPGSRPSVLCIS